MTALYCGVGLADPLVASVSLDRSCKVYSLAQGTTAAIACCSLCTLLPEGHPAVCRFPRAEQWTLTQHTSPRLPANGHAQMAACTAGSAV